MLVGVNEGVLVGVGVNVGVTGCEPLGFVSVGVIVNVIDGVFVVVLVGVTAGVFVAV